LTDQPELTATDDERTTLYPSGAWTVTNVEVLESLCAGPLPVKVAAIDLSRVTALDTVGAWLFEKLLRRFSTASARTSLVGVSESYVGLMQEVQSLNRRQPDARRRDNLILDSLERIGALSQPKARVSCRCWARSASHCSACCAIRARCG
jgi:phospholipid/cholesterol/gamma-HCH transport system permease protein